MQLINSDGLSNVLFARKGASCPTRFPVDISIKSAPTEGPTGMKIGSASKKFWRK